MPSHFDLLKRLIEGRVIAVVRLDSGDQLIQVAQALKDGGITAIEFTIPTPGALDMIKLACAHFGDEVIMGAGTVLDPETARAALLSGAQFIVTPALNFKTIELCHRYGKPILPGALTPTEILNAWEAGAEPSSLATMTLLPVSVMALYSVLINVFLALFNLIPIPPLDGGRILTCLLPPQPALALAKLEPYGMMILMGLIVFDKELRVIHTITGTFANALSGTLLSTALGFGTGTMK